MLFLWLLSFVTIHSYTRMMIQDHPGRISVIKIEGVKAPETVPAPGNVKVDPLLIELYFIQFYPGSQLFFAIREKSYHSISMSKTTRTTMIS